MYHSCVYICLVLFKVTLTVKMCVSTYFYNVHVDSCDIAKSKLWVRIQPETKQRLLYVQYTPGFTGSLVLGTLPKAIYYRPKVKYFFNNFKTSTFFLNNFMCAHTYFFSCSSLKLRNELMTFLCKKMQSNWMKVIRKENVTQT